MDFLHIQRTFSLACLVMMMRIFGKWPSTSCAAYDQKDQAIQLKFIILKKDLLSQVQFRQNAQLFANFWYQKSTLQPSHSPNGQFESSGYTWAPAEQFSYEEINELRLRPLKLDHPCHNQAVERHVKLVSEGSASTTGHERLDGIIRQIIQSRKLMTFFETYTQFNV